MIRNYRVALNIEWTSKCNARCSMCPRGGMAKGQNMSPGIFDKTLQRINARDVSRCVIAGYGEPVTHPDFDAFVARLEDTPVRFDMATNGELLSEERLRKIDGKLGLLLISFSSIVPEVYAEVHRFLDYSKVVENILIAQRTLKKTVLGISLSPVPPAIATLDETITWFKQHGIHTLTMSPTLYNRGGAGTDFGLSPGYLRQVIKRYGLHSQELDFVTGIRDFFGQWLNNEIKCPARNSDLFISSAGDYLDCFNDINHLTCLGNVNDTSIRDILRVREQSRSCSALCSECNLANRYGASELVQVAVKYGGNRFREMFNID